jgi:hypothetical protein
MKIEAEIKKAGAVTPTSKSIEQTKSYHQVFGESKKIFREFIELMLLRLVAGQVVPSGWQILDQLLHQLYVGDAL